MNIWKYIHNGQTFGPVEIAQLQRLIDTGMLNGESLLQKEGSADWVPARTVPELNFSARPEAASNAGAISTGAPATGSAPPPVTGPTPDADDVEKNKVYAIVAYIGILFLVPLLAAPNSKFARYHANQGLVLFLAVVILMVGAMVLMMIPFIGCVMAIAPLAISAVAIVMMVLGIMNAAAGQCKPLPVIGHYQILK